MIYSLIFFLCEQTFYPLVRFLGRFQTTSQTYYDDIEVRATVESIVEFEPKLESFTEQLMEMKAAQSRVYLLYAR